MQLNSVWESVNYQMANGLLSADTLVNLEQFWEICLVATKKMFSHHFSHQPNRKSDKKQELNLSCMSTDFQIKLSKFPFQNKIKFQFTFS